MTPDRSGGGLGRLWMVLASLHDASFPFKALTNSGVVPQQPPMKLAPASTSAGAYDAKASAVCLYTVRPSAISGSPALALIQTGRSVADRMRRADGHEGGDSLPAVRADPVGAGLDQRLNRLLDGGAHHRAVLVGPSVKDHAPDDGQARRLRGANGKPGLRWVRHGFHHNPVGAGLGLRLRLFGESRLQLFLGRLTHQEQDAARADRTRRPARRRPPRDGRSGRRPD